MNTDRDLPSPPLWAEQLLRLLLHPRDRESVTGDLLEEYRETIIPTLGRKANAWYLRQVAWYLLRATLAPGILIGMTLVIRYLFDALAPVPYSAGVVHLRSRIMSHALLAILAFASGSSAWRTTQVRTGMVIAIGSGIVGGLISIVGTGLMLIVWHDPHTLAAWRMSGGLDEALVGVPVLLVPISVVVGGAGALVGKYLGVPLRRRQ